MGVVAGQNHALRPRIVHIAGLCGFGDVNHHRAGAAGTCHIVRFSQHARNVLRTRDQIGVLDHRVGCADDIGFLEGVGAQQREPTCPVTSTSGVESISASASPVTVFVAPGPEVTRQTPTRPLTRA